MIVIFSLCLVETVKNHYETIRKYARETGESICSCGWLLDIARCIYTLRNNNIISKTQAGIRALENQVFQNGETLTRAIEICQHPLVFKNRDDVKRWLSELGSMVQQYADVLVRELLLYRD